MRCSPHAVLGTGIALGFGLIAALVTSDCTPMLCSRNSDCPTGEICTSRGGCAIAPDAAPDGAGDDGGSAATDAATDDAATDASALPTDAAQSSGGGSAYREAAPWPP